ncbi:MAG TPA: c-type cytochrome [Polyangiales bacterium]|nr:c-type cytochrome [Polyangiales bacterium]
MRTRTKNWLRRAALALIAAVALVAAGVGSGVAPVNASSGHWAITAWFLHTAMRRSVSTHALAVELPPSDADWLVLKGAGHFETGCRPCHGAPDLRAPVIPGAMTPHPPVLSAELLGEWSDAQLFYIVKHGVKFTAMPAWPSQQRDDEVMALVAFLRALPTLDAQAYRRLVHGGTGSARAAGGIAKLVATETSELAVSCARCHGERGEGRENAAFPRLAGQKQAYQEAALEAYASGARHSGIMQPIAAALSREQMRTLSAYYAAQPSVRGASSVDPARTRGERTAREGIPARGVPACAECHGPSDVPRSEAYPALAGQYADYLALQLRLFKARQRGGSPYLHLMHEVASRLEGAQLSELALYYEGLAPAAR